MNTRPIIYTAQATFGAYMQGCEDARNDEWCDLSVNSLDSQEGAAVRRSYQVGFMAECVRIANRRMTGRQRDLLIAHDRAASAFNVAAAHFGGAAFKCEAFAYADLALFGLNPWDVLGIRLAQYQGPAGQAKDRLYVPARKQA